MKTFTCLSLLTTLIIFGCHRRSGTTSNEVATKNKIFTLDIALKDTVQRHIKLLSNKHFSSFETPADVRFFSDGVLVDSVITPYFHIISWYSNRKDTIDLVAHVGEFETQALLVRFIHNIPHVFYFRAPHENQKYFRLNKTDPFINQIEVPPVRYKLGLSKVPDTIQKPVVFGSIDMESGIYFDQRDSLKGKRVQMKFYFSSQFRNFDYPE